MKDAANYILYFMGVWPDWAAKCKKKQKNKPWEKHQIYKKKQTVPRDFPRGPVAKTVHSQCRGPGFDPWSGN